MVPRPYWGLTNKIRIDSAISNGYNKHGYDIKANMMVSGPMEETIIILIIGSLHVLNCYIRSDLLFTILHIQMMIVYNNLIRTNDGIRFETYDLIRLKSHCFNLVIVRRDL